MSRNRANKILARDLSECSIVPATMPKSNTRCVLNRFITLIKSCATQSICSIVQSGWRDKYSCIGVTGTLEDDLSKFWLPFFKWCGSCWHLRINDEYGLFNPCMLELMAAVLKKEDKDFWRFAAPDFDSGRTI